MSEELDPEEQSDLQAALAGKQLPSSLYSAREVAEKLIAATAELRRELEEVKRERDCLSNRCRVLGNEATWAREERDALKREVEGLREFARDVWTTLSKDLHHGEGFNKKLFRDRAGEFFEQDKSPQKYS